MFSDEDESQPEDNIAALDPVLQQTSPKKLMINQVFKDSNASNYRLSLHNDLNSKKTMMRHLTATPGNLEQQS